MHIGWNSVEFDTQSYISHVANGKQFYFNHHILTPECQYVVGKTAIKPGLEIVSAVKKKYYWGSISSREKSRELEKTS